MRSVYFGLNLPAVTHFRGVIGLIIFYCSMPYAADMALSWDASSSSPDSYRLYKRTVGQDSLCIAFVSEKPGYGTWLANHDVSDISNPFVYHLEADAHMLKIQQGKDGAQLDKILITNDTKYIL